jgi:hypothetical protein
VSAGGELYIMKSGFQGVRTHWIRGFMASETGVGRPGAGTDGTQEVRRVTEDQVSGAPEEDEGAVVGTADLPLHGRD